MSTVSLNSNNRSRVHPQKFALWLSMGSILMMFAAFTSAYLIKQSSGTWVEFVLPQIFYINTGVIVCSSIALHISCRAFISGKELIYKSGLVVALILGIAFLVFQYQGWNALFEMGIDLKGNASGAFLYLISFVHAAHIIGGIAALVLAILHAFTLKYKVTDKRKNRFEMTLHYWHFVDLLWVYLFVFLLFSK